MYQARYCKIILYFKGYYCRVPNIIFYLLYLCTKFLLTWLTKFKVEWSLTLFKLRNYLICYREGRTRRSRVWCLNLIVLRLKLLQLSWLGHVEKIGGNEKSVLLRPTDPKVGHPRCTTPGAIKSRKTYDTGDWQQQAQNQGPRWNLV